MKKTTGNFKYFIYVYFLSIQRNDDPLFMMGIHFKKVFLVTVIFTPFKQKHFFSIPSNFSFEDLNWPFPEDLSNWLSPIFRIQVTVV